jgi:hypothetical protein
VRIHYGIPRYRPACGITARTPSGCSTDKGEVTCQRCKTTLQWDTNWWTPDHPLDDLDTRTVDLLHMVTQHGTPLCGGGGGGLTPLDNRVTCQACNDMLALVPKRSGQPWAGPLRVALTEALDRRTFLIDCDLDGEWMVALCEDADVIDEIGFGPTAEAAMRHALGAFMRVGQ